MNRLLYVECMYDDGEHEPHVCEQVGVFASIEAIDAYMTKRFRDNPHFMIRASEDLQEHPYWTLVDRKTGDENMDYIVWFLPFFETGLEDRD